MYKAALQRFFSAVPGGSTLNDLFRRHVTGGLPASDQVLLEHAGYAAHYVEMMRTFDVGDIADATFYEFGAGSDLIIPLALYGFGVDRQVLVDIRRLAARDLVMDAARRLAASADLNWARRVPEMADKDLRVALERAYGIEYRAPCDARATPLAGGSVDVVHSTNTLEHIAPADIQAILVECGRILKPTGILVARIDYQDHYSYFDRSITAYNFLLYEDAQWRTFSPGLHFQNRLRHDDHLRLFRASGFEILDDRPILGSDQDLATLRSMQLASSFRDRELADLAVRGSCLVARPQRR